MNDVRASNYKPLSDLEREVCLRFGQARRFARLSQFELAKGLHVTRNQVANIECARAPLRFGIGIRFCELLDINQSWLAKGTLPKSPFRKFDNNQVDLASYSNELFSVVCLGNLSEFLELRERLVRSAKSVEDASEFLSQTYEELFSALVRVMVLEVPARARLDYLHFVIAQTKRFANSSSAGNPNPSKGPELYSEQAQIESELSDAKSPLTDVAGLVNNQGVKSPMAILLARLRQVGATPGKKAALAKFLGVSPVSVSRWVSGEREPGGEITLRMLEWVTTQEGLNKENSNSVTSTAGAKTQQRKSRHENPSGLKKK